MNREIVPAKKEHVEALALNMRRPDVDECWAAAHMAPYEALQRSVLVSDEPLTGLADGHVACIFGVSSLSPLSDDGHPWLLGSDDMDRHAIPLLRGSVRYVAAAAERYRTLSNYVDARNVKAVQWVAWLGFTVDEPKPYGIERLPFHYFHLEA